MPGFGPGGGSDGGVVPAAGSTPTPAPNLRLSGFEERMNVDIPVLVRPESTVSGFLIEHLR